MPTLQISILNVVSLDQDVKKLGSQVQAEKVACQRFVVLFLLYKLAKWKPTSSCFSQVHRRQAAQVELAARLEPETIELLVENDEEEASAHREFVAAYHRLEEIFSKRVADWQQETSSFDQASKVSLMMCHLRECCATCTSFLLFICPSVCLPTHSLILPCCSVHLQTCCATCTSLFIVCTSVRPSICPSICLHTHSLVLPRCSVQDLNPNSKAAQEARHLSNMDAIYGELLDQGRQRKELLDDLAEKLQAIRLRAEICSAEGKVS